MGSPVIVNDGSPVKITWFDDDAWDLDVKTQTLTKRGKYRVSAALFNLVHHVKFETPPTLRIGFTSGSQHATLLVTTDEDRRSLRLQIADLPEGRKFCDFFAPPEEDFTPGNKLQTPEDGSITSISYGLGGIDAIKRVHTLRHLPTSVMFMMDDVQTAECAESQAAS